MKTINDCKWNLIKVDVCNICKRIFNFFFCKHLSDDRPFRPTLVANNIKTIKYYIVVSDGVHVKVKQSHYRRLANFYQHSTEKKNVHQYCEKPRLLRTSACCRT